MHAVQWQNLGIYLYSARSGPGVHSPDSCADLQIFVERRACRGARRLERCASPAVVLITPCKACDGDDDRPEALRARLDRRARQAFLRFSSAYLELRRACLARVQIGESLL